MSNHLSPAQIAERFDLDEAEVFHLCDTESIPILHGKIDKSLFNLCLKKIGKDRLH
jgi:hypothetical protein